MKKIKLIAVAFLMISAAKAQKNQAGNYQIKGSLSRPASAGKMYLSYRNNDKVQTDSVLVNKGEFAFSGHVNEPVLATLRFSPADGKPFKRSFSFYVEAAPIQVSLQDSLKTGVVSGSKTDQDFQFIRTRQSEFRSKMEPLNAKAMAYDKSGDTSNVSKTVAEMNRLNTGLRDNTFKVFIKDHPASPVSLYALSQSIGYVLNPDEVEPVFKTLSASVQNLPSGQALAKRIAIASNSMIGHYAQDFAQADTTGKMISLSSFKGKYVLVDFWASWCGPCRAENPNVVKTYNKYKDKGFTILGVSLDSKKENWLKAIAADHLFWTQVSDLQYWNNSAAKLYGISAIPQNMLLDPQGRIIAKNVRGEALNKTLSALFEKGGSASASTGK